MKHARITLSLFIFGLALGLSHMAVAQSAAYNPPSNTSSYSPTFYSADVNAAAAQEISQANKPNLDEEELAPLVPPQPAALEEGSAETEADSSTDELPQEESTPAAEDSTATAVDSELEPQAGPSTETKTSYAPIVVENISAEVSDSVGVERDKALAIAARLAMPQALQQMDPPVTGEKAQTFINAQGDLTRYVKSVQVVKELLVPHYTLVATLTFDADKLYANLGGRVPAKAQPKAAPKSTTASPASPATSPTVNPLAEVRQNLLLVYLDSTTPADSSKLYRILNKLPNTSASYAAITTQGASFNVKTTLSRDALEQQLMLQNLSRVPTADFNELHVTF